jgi:hypothetical protein
MRAWPLYVCAVLGFLSSPVLAASQFAPVEASLSIQSADLSRQALALPVGSRLELRDVAFGASMEALELERFEVFSDDFEMYVDGEPVGRPATGARYRGTVAGDPTSQVLVTFRADGSHRGLVVGADGTWVLEGGWTGRVESLGLGGEPEGFECALGDLERHGAQDAGLGDLLTTGMAPLPTLDEMAVFDHTARVAVETDYELYQKFGNVQDATDYVADLFAYASITYEREVATSLVVSTLYLWTNSSDPWSENDSVSCAFRRFGSVWNANRGSIDRTIAHFLSGKNQNSGIAWLGVLCSGAFNGGHCGNASWEPSGGAYGYTGGIDANFSINSPQIVWDIVAVMHEIGHNFDSDHTHCYNGVGGNNQPVDQCYNGEAGFGCYGGAELLPGPGRSGTLMSYCHQLPGGFNNIAMTFGEDHPFGVEPERVPSRMRQHVALRASVDPLCLAPVVIPAGVLLSDGFESGTFSAWSSVVP